MKMTTYLVEGVTAFLVKVLLRPKVYYLEPPRRRRRHGEHRKQLPFHPGAAMLAAVSQAPLVMVYIDGPIKILGPRARMIVSPQFHLDPPTEGMNAEYLMAQTQMLQEKMKGLMEELVKRL